MTLIVFAIGAVCVIEGLVLALAPSRIENLLRAFADLPVETRRLIGAAALATGVFLIALARWLGL
ncbi:DUF2065 domain-containing protein [Anianabacter salinae]|uniref:DUF2065 domain-containing protein n=1 Tax=Anianabacter salinae TaxID=2851023 RepID=UPI00225E52CB|nr:DUF2065 domain-containing protein [Anianabacter salinae]MBV0911731.1 DUF2065 domain-containing protein [Anianabacter salinae]